MDVQLKASIICDDITYVGEAGLVQTLKGVFTDEFVDELNSELRSPSVYVDLSDVAGTIRGSLVEYGGTQYRVRQVERDGDGWATFRLEQQ